VYVNVSMDTRGLLRLHSSETSDLFICLAKA